jgi:AcrR family transcriptional regulator
MNPDLNTELHANPSLLLNRPSAPDGVRADILKAAATAFNERGYAATSIDDVADRLGATKGRIYHYYRSKTDIFLDLHLESLRLTTESVGGIAADLTLSPRERLREMCFAHAMVVMTQLTYQKSTMLGLNSFLLSISAPYQDEARKRVNDLRDRYESLFVSTIAQGIEAGEFRQADPRFVVKPLLGVLNYATIWYEQARDEALGTVEQIANALADFCVSGLLQS